MDAEVPIERDDGASGRDHQPRAEPMADATVPDGGAGGTLRSAMRTARIEDAERSRAIADVRSAEIARLDLLREAIEPVLAAVPSDVEMFDAGLIPVPQPRLFVDMIAFVEMAHDKRRYRFVQDTRQGRIRLAESDSVAVMREAITAYIARRLVEREKALAVDAGPALDQGPAGRPLVEPEWEASIPAGGWLRAAAALALNYLGVVALCVLVWVLGHALYHYWLPPR